MSAQPTQTCTTCGRVVICQVLGRSAGPDPAKRKLVKLCKADGHRATPQYRAGVAPPSAWRLALGASSGGDPVAPEETP